MLPAVAPHGAAVFDRAGERVGHIEDVIIDELTGRAAYALVCHGGFLGVGRRYRPLPWSLLAYDARRDGYVVALTRVELASGPSFYAAAFTAHDGAYRDKVHRHYARFGVSPYWT